MNLTIPPPRPSGYYREDGKFIPKPHRGEKHHHAKLTAEKVREMRRLSWEHNVPTSEISRHYGVQYSTAWEAINCVTWRGV